MVLCWSVPKCEAVSYKCLLSLLYRKSWLCSSVNSLKKKCLLWLQESESEQMVFSFQKSDWGKALQSHLLLQHLGMIHILMRCSRGMICNERGYKNSGVEVDLVRTKWEEVLQDWAAAERGIQSGITYFHRQSNWLFMQICRILLVTCQKSSGVRSAFRSSVTIKKYW